MNLVYLTLLKGKNLKMEAGSWQTIWGWSVSLILPTGQRFTANVVSYLTCLAIFQKIPTFTIQLYLYLSLSTLFFSETGADTSVQLWTTCSINATCQILKLANISQRSIEKFQLKVVLFFHFSILLCALQATGGQQKEFSVWRQIFTICQQWHEIGEGRAMRWVTNALAHNLHLWCQISFKKHHKCTQLKAVFPSKIIWNRPTWNQFIECKLLPSLAGITLCSWDFSDV